jgi:hypothetical protein
LLCPQDDFYLRHLIKNNLLDPVMDAFFANGDRYNLLNSAVLEMVEFIRKENLKVCGCGCGYLFCVGGEGLWGWGGVCGRGWIFVEWGPALQGL